jgi:hypothetical protein
MKIKQMLMKGIVFRFARDARIELRSIRLPTSCLDSENKEEIPLDKCAGNEDSMDTVLSGSNSESSCRSTC